MPAVLINADAVCDNIITSNNKIPAGKPQITLKVKVKAKAKVNVKAEQFIVNLLDNGPVFDDVKLIQANVKKIIDWYTARLKNDYFVSYASDMKVTHVEGKIFLMEFNINDDEMLDVDMLMDPDDDGNHPIKLGRRTFLISGRKPWSVVDEDDED